MLFRNLRFKMLTHNSSIHITERMSGYPQLDCRSGWKTWTEEGGHHKKKQFQKGWNVGQNLSRFLQTKQSQDGKRFHEDKVE